MPNSAPTTHNESLSETSQTSGDTHSANSSSDLPKVYDRGYRWLHWLMSGLFLLMFFAFFGFAAAETDLDRMTMLVGHSSIGTLITVLLIVRISKRFIKRDPTPQADISKSLHLISRTVQYALYCLMVIVPVTGYLTAQGHALPVEMFGSFNISQMTYIEGETKVYGESFDLLRSIHSLSVKLLLGLVVLHIAGALFHKLVKKDGVMGLMTGKQQ